MIKKIVLAERQTSKTTELIKKCGENKNSIIVCPTRDMCVAAFRQSKMMGIDIPMPITFYEFVRGYFYPEYVTYFYFDELQLSLQYLTKGVPIDTVIMGTENCEVEVRKAEETDPDNGKENEQ